MSELTPFYPIEYKLDTYHKNQLWECPPVLPRYDLTHLDKIIKKPLTREEKTRIKSGDVILINH